MNNLLSANFTRLRKSRTILASVIFMETYVAAVLIYVQIQVSLGSEIAFDTLFLNGYGLGGFIAFPGLLLSVVCGIFIGTDFSDGTLRNKIVAGKSREKIYLSNFFTCSFVGIVLNLIYVTVICVVGLPRFGGIEMPVHPFLYLILDGTLMIVAYTSFYNMLTMLLKDKTTAVVAGMVITLVSMFLSFYLMMRTFEPEFITITSLTDSDIAEKVVPNKKYLSGCAVKIVQFIDFLPSGQSIQISHMTAPNIQYMWLYSFMIIMITNITGISVFRKTDLK